VERILTAAIETSAAQSGGDSYALPAAIAPFEVVVTVTNVKDAAMLAAGESIAAELAAAGVDVLLDDRDERAGVKFKDADLIGVPYRVAVGKGLVDGRVELLDRLQSQTKDVAVDEIVAAVTTALAAGKA
jgi:prolyl-tRNA synthetase